MAIFLMLLIVAILLFGAAAVRSTLASVLFFVAMVAGALTLWFGASQLSARDWVTLLLLGLAIVGLICGWSAYAASKADREAKRRAIRQVWDFYDQRGLFSADGQVLGQATELLRLGDKESLQNYCSEAYLRVQFEGHLPDRVALEGELPTKVWPPADSPVHRVWAWNEAAIEQQFGPEDQRLARRLFQANDAHGLDRHCRGAIAGLKFKESQS